MYEISNEPTFEKVGSPTLNQFLESSESRTHECSEKEVQLSQILSSGVTDNYMIESQKRINDIGIETDEINSPISPFPLKKP